MRPGKKPPKEVDVRKCFAQRPPLTVDWYDVAHVTIVVLPDVALLEIFHFYVDDARNVVNAYQEKIEAWHTLVHVCRKWRSVVFGSPLRLNLRLHCTESTPVRKTLDVWPILPIVVWSSRNPKWSMDNIVAVLEHNHRIYELDLGHMPDSEFEKVLATMQQPFPALKNLYLSYTDVVIPASFLGGSALQLQSLIMDGILFPALPKLLLSATHLVHLRLEKIPHSGYIPPETMVSCLSALTRLKFLIIGFKSPQSRPDRRRPPPPTRTLLPVLTSLRFEGVCKYLDDFLARIDAPLLKELEVAFFHQLIFDTPQLNQFISRTPNLKTHNEAQMEVYPWHVSVRLPTQSALSQTFVGEVELKVLCQQADWQLSSLAQVCSSFFPQTFISAVEHLYIKNTATILHWKPEDDIESSQWLEFFHPFIGVKNLYVSSAYTPYIVPALQELFGESGTEALPSLQTLFLEDPPPSGPIQEAIGKIVAARQLADHPVAVSPWGSEEGESSYESDKEEDESSHPRGEKTDVD